MLEKSCESRISKATTSADAIEECVSKACDAYFSQSFNPNDELLKAQLKRMGKKSDSVDWDKVKKHDTLYISSKFDVRQQSSDEVHARLSGNSKLLVHRKGTLTLKLMK
jgi:hypothetical protein